MAWTDLVERGLRGQPHHEAFGIEWGQALQVSACLTPALSAAMRGDFGVDFDQQPTGHTEERFGMVGPLGEERGDLCQAPARRWLGSPFQACLQVREGRGLQQETGDKLGTCYPSGFTPYISSSSGSGQLDLWALGKEMLLVTQVGH